MARSQSAYSVGNRPPMVTWTVVRGDTAAFKAYVTDDAKQPLTVTDWDILMKVKRPNLLGKEVIITDDAEVVLTLTPAPEIDELPGYFTVSLAASESQILQTGDIFDIQLSQPDRVWTVAQGSMIILEDVTD
jgi:hypothetical protein